MIRLLGNKLTVELDPEVRMIGSIHMPDTHTLRYCRKCNKMMEQLEEGGCEPVETFRQDKYHDRPVFDGTDTSHDYGYCEAPVIESPSRVGTVRRCGTGVVEIKEGDRIIISNTAGGTLTDTRTVREDVVLAKVED